MNKSGEETILSLPERHNRILALLQQNGSISVAQLAELFKRSPSAKTSPISNNRKNCTELTAVRF
jgi:predicted HTH transcriptional regulator